jgi:hypothetical protein
MLRAEYGTFDLIGGCAPRRAAPRAASRAAPRGPRPAVAAPARRPTGGATGGTAGFDRSRSGVARGFALYLESVQGGFWHFAAPAALLLLPALLRPARPGPSAGAGAGAGGAPRCEHAVARFAAAAWAFYLFFFLWRCRAPAPPAPVARRLPRCVPFRARLDFDWSIGARARLSACALAGTTSRSTTHSTAAC